MKEKRKEKKEKKKEYFSRAPEVTAPSVTVKANVRKTALTTHAKAVPEDVDVPVLCCCRFHLVRGRLVTPSCV